MRLLALPGEYELQASFEGTGDLKPSSASMPFIIGKQDTVLTLGAQSAITPNNAATFFVATLKDALGRPLSEKTVFVVVTGANGTHVVPAITDFAGRVPVSELLLADGTPLPVGAYQVEADFSGDIPRPPLARLTTLEDARYLPSTVSGSLIVKCPLSQGYWKNHVDLWPVSSLTLGTGTYNKAQLINIMNNTTTSDASVILARQLIATLLNLANNSSPIPVSSTIADANRQLDGCTLPCKVNVRSGNGAAMVKNASFLETYNTGGLTPGCTP